MKNIMHLISVTAIAMLCVVPVGTLADAPAPSCTVRVLTDPGQATVIFDGKVQDAPPVSIPAAHGEHLLVVRKKGYVDHRQTVDIAPGQSRELVEIKLTPIQGLLLIASEPSGATVTINRATRGSTPLLVTDIPLGKHRITLRRSGYADIQKQIVVKDRTPQKLSVKLPRNSAMVSVTSEPSGAEVFIDGSSRGPTPCEVAGLPLGETKITLKLDGYSDYTTTVSLKSMEPLTVKGVLKAVPGKLTIHSIPDGALVYVNNQRRGQTPFTLKDMEPDRYRVRVELTGYSPMARFVAVKRGKEVIEEFRLEKNSGLLQITSQPAGVQVFIDGVDRGKTEAAASDAISRPLLIDLLKVGIHNIQLTKRGYESQSKRIAVAKDATATLQITLKRLFVPDTVIETVDGQVFVGVVLTKLPNGDVRMETKPGVQRYFRKGRIRSIKPHNVDR